jgi:hypothetical protein
MVQDPINPTVWFCELDRQRSSAPPVLVWSWVPCMPQPHPAWHVWMETRISSTEKRMEWIQITVKLPDKRDQSVWRACWRPTSVTSLVIKFISLLCRGKGDRAWWPPPVSLPSWGLQSQVTAATYYRENKDLFPPPSISLGLWNLSYQDFSRPRVWNFTVIPFTDMLS